jgi:hypothetical protein
MPHMVQPPPMQVPHMMQPQFFYMPGFQAQVRPHAIPAHPNTTHPNTAQPNTAHANAVHPNAASASANLSGHSNAVHANTAHPNTAHANAAHVGVAKSSHTNTTNANTSLGAAGHAAAAASTLAPGMTPNNTMHFPSNNVINFPANNVLNFPSQVSVVNTGLPTLNFPSQASIYPFPTMSGGLGGQSQFPSYVTNLGSAALVPGTTARSHAIPTAMLATPVGLGGMAHGFNTHYWGRRIPYYGSYGNYTSTNTAQQHMNRLIADLDSLAPGFQTTNYHYNRLQGDMMAVSLNYRRPQSNLVHGLSRSIALGMTRRQSPTINTAALAQGLRIVVNAGHLPPGEVNTAIAQSQYLLHEGGLAPADVKAVVADMHAIAGQAQLGLGYGQAIR